MGVKNTIFKFVVSASLLFTYFTIYSQIPEHLNFKKYSVENGLSNNFITSLFLDYKGFLWISTLDGLNRFDSYEFHKFRHMPNDSTSLPETHGLSISEDKNHNFWFITKDGSLCVYDKKNQSFAYIKDLYPKNLNLRVNTILCDSLGFMWIGFNESGIGKMNISTFEFEKIDSDSLISNSTINDIFSDKSGNIYFISNYHIWKYSSATKKISTFLEGLFADGFQSLSFVRSFSGNQIWMGFIGGKLFSYNTKTELLTEHKLSSEIAKSSLSSPFSIFSMTEDKKHNIWIGSNRGLICYDPKTGNSKAFTNNENDPESISNNDVSSILLGDSDVLWIGTFSGLNQIILRDEYFHSKTIQGADKFANVKSILTDDRKNIWMGGTRSGLLILPEDQKPEIPKHQFPKLKDKNVKSLIRADKTTVWAGTTSDGIYVMDIETHKIKYQLNKESGLKSNNITALLKDSRDRIWIGTAGGLHLYDTEKKILTFLKIENDEHSISSNNIRCIFEDKTKTIWIGTESGGMNKYIENSGSFIRYVKAGYNKNSISDNTVYSISEDNQKNLWIGTLVGLNKYDIEQNAFTVLTIDDGLPSNSILSTQIDNDNNLWLSTYNGLSSLNLDTKVLKTFYKSDGLKRTDFTSGSSYKSDIGLLYFGQPDGIIYFNPQIPLEENEKSHLTFTSFEKSGNAFRTGIDYNLVDTISISFSDAFFSIGYSELNYINPTSINYSYQLEGFDKNWVSAGKLRKVSYTNIDPGVYKFKVRSTNNNGEWHQNYISGYIQIHPLFYQRTIFKIILVCILGLFVYIIMRYRIFKIKQIEKARWQIAGDLHDEIGGNLSSIALRTELLVRTSDQFGQAEKVQLNQIISKSRKMVDQIDDIVWSVNPENDKLEDMIYRMKDFAVELFSAHFIAHTFLIENVDSSKHLPLSKKKNIFLIFKETLNNIIKHSQATEVKISIEYERSNLKLSISDNGIGFDDKVVKNGYGLKTQRRRCSEIDGKLSISSDKETGTTVQLSVKI